MTFVGSLPVTDVFSGTTQSSRPYLPRLYPLSKTPSNKSSTLMMTLESSSSSSASTTESTTISINETQWNSAAELLRSYGGMSDDDDTEISKILSRAFGWTSQAYWRGQRTRSNPSLDAIQNALKVFTHELQLQPNDIRSVLRKFPEAMALDEDGTQLRDNQRYMKDTLRMDAERVRKSVIAQPQALGYNFDCGGDCQGECVRCWVRF